MDFLIKHFHYRLLAYPMRDSAQTPKKAKEKGLIYMDVSLQLESDLIPPRPPPTPSPLYPSPITIHLQLRGTLHLLQFSQTLP